VSQAQPLFLQRDSKATNIRVGSAKSKTLTFPPSICANCNNTLTQPFDVAWRKLSQYLRTHWAAIVARGNFDLSKAFPGGTRAAALNVHLYFVKLVGCKINEEGVPIYLAPFRRALLNVAVHPEVSITVAEAPAGTELILMRESEVHTMTHQPSGDMHGALWAYAIGPVVIKVAT
jgi:hypothetical protein